MFLFALRQHFLLTWTLSLCIALFFVSLFCFVLFLYRKKTGEKTLYRFFSFIIYVEWTPYEVNKDICCCFCSRKEVEMMWNVNDDGGWRLVVAMVVRRRNAIFRMSNWDTNGFPSHVTIKICILSCWYLLLEPLRGQVGSPGLSLSHCLSIEMKCL